jgi:NitT/TauT family transport system ATP-binding protein
VSDVEEAVYVSGCLRVMTNRPGRVKRELPVPPPRPRSYDMASCEEFGEIYGEESIREELLRVAELGGAVA